MKEHTRSNSHASVSGQSQLSVTGYNPFDDTSSSTPSSPSYQRSRNPFGSTSLNPFGSTSSSSSHNPFPLSDSSSVNVADARNPFQSDCSSLESLHQLKAKLPTTLAPSRTCSLEDVKSERSFLSSSVQSSPSKNSNAGSGSSRFRNPRYSSSSYDSTFTETTTPAPLTPEPEAVVAHRHKANMTSILNDPYRRSKNYDADLFTRNFGSYFVPSPVVPAKHLPLDVPQESFIAYLKYLKDPWKQNRAKEKEAIAISRSRQKSSEDLDIDTRFLDPNFSLEDKETFEYVLPWSHFEIQHNNHVSPKEKKLHGSKRSQRSSTKLLQEKLSYNLDKVEILLAQQVSAKHNKFFETISSQERLNDDSNLIRNDIRKLRNSLNVMDTEVNKNALKILQLGRLRANYWKCHELVVQMSTVRQAQPTIQLLLTQSDFVGALDLIAATQEVLQNDLAGIKSFRYLNVQLCEMERMIYNMIQSDFIKFTLSTLTLDDKTDIEIESDTEKIICVLFGLLRGKNVSFIQNYKTEANTMMKARIKQVLAETLSDISFETDMKLDDQIRSLSSSVAVDLIDGVFDAVTKLLTKMSRTDKMIKAVIASAGNRQIPGEYLETLSEHASSTLRSQQHGDVPWVLSDAEYERLILEISEVLVTSCEIAQSQCIKIISLHQQRTTTTERIHQGSLFRLSRLVDVFAATCEAITGKPSNLRVALLGQSREVVRQFHDERVTNIRLLLETERWTVAEVPADFQRIASSIVRKATPSEVLARPPGSRGNEPPQNYLLLNGRKFVVTGTLLLVIKILVEYCQCVDDIPVMAKDILTKTVENLRNFNETTCQLVLMAGAMRNIGLKSITAKHLGVASQTLNVVLELIPWVRHVFQIHIKQRRLVDQLDHLETDIQDHINQIFSKLINIMGEVYKTNLCHWNPKPPTPSPHITIVTKQTIKLHEALIPILQPCEIQTVFKGVFCLFRKYFEEQLTKHGLMNSSSRKHGIVGSELSFYTDSVNILDFVGDTDDIFHDIGTR